MCGAIFHVQSKFAIRKENNNMNLQKLRKKSDSKKNLDFFKYGNFRFVFSFFFGFLKYYFFVLLFLKFPRILLNITEVTTKHKKWPKISQNTMQPKIWRGG